MSDTSILDSLTPVGPTPGMLAAGVGASRPQRPASSSTSILDSLTPVQPTSAMRMANPTAFAAPASTQPASPSLPDWAIHDQPVAPQAATTPEPQQPTPQAVAGDFMQRYFSPNLWGSPTAVAENKGIPQQAFGGVGEPPDVQQSLRSGVLGAIPSGAYEGLAKAANLPTAAANLPLRLLSAATGQDYGSFSPPFNENPTGFQASTPVAQAVHDAASAASNTVALGGAARIATPLLPEASTARTISQTLENTPPSVVGASAVGGASEEPIARNVPESMRPLARIGANVAAGGLTAGLESAAGNAAASTVPAETARLANLARSTYGIPVTPAQISGNRIIKQADSMLRSVPFTGYGAADESIRSAWTKALTKEFGEDSGKLTPEVLNQAYSRIGNVFNEVGQRTNVAFDNQLQSELDAIKTKAGEVGLDQGQVNAIHNQADKIAQIAQDNSGVIPGNVYVNLTKRGESLDLLQGNRSTTVGQLGGDIRDALDDAFLRSASPQDAAALQQARAQYKVLKTVEPLTMRATRVGNNSPAEGDITPEQLLARVNRQYPNAARAPLGSLPVKDLAQIADRFIKELPTSQTAERTNMMRWIERGMAGLGGADALGLPGVEYAREAIVPAAVGLAAGRGAASVLRSDALANRLINGALSNPATPTQAAGQASVPLLTSAGVRQLEPPAEPQTSRNPATGLPEYNLAANQQQAGDAKRQMADAIAQKVASGELADHSALRNWIGQNKRELRTLFGGQGIQNIMMVAAMLRRAAMGQPSSLFAAITRQQPPQELANAMTEAGAADAPGLASLAIRSPQLAQLLAVRTGNVTKTGQRRLIVALQQASQPSASSVGSDPGSPDLVRPAVPSGATTRQGNNLSAPEIQERLSGSPPPAKGALQ